jgi:hypothetical protein
MTASLSSQLSPLIRCADALKKFDNFMTFFKGLSRPPENRATVVCLGADICPVID